MEKPPQHNDDKKLEAQASLQIDNTAIVDGLDPAERDARWLRRWYPVSFVGKLAISFLCLLIVFLVCVYYAIGTETGTRFLLNTIVQQTGIQLQYNEGNLRDGLRVRNIKIPTISPDNPISVTVDNAYIKIGWRAIFSKEVHLRKAEVGNIIIHNAKPPTGEPFSFKRVALPVNLRLDNASVNLVRYQQVNMDTIDFKQGKVTGFTWIGSEIRVKQGDVKYNNLLDINKVSGKIDLQKDYPINASANITIHTITKAHFGAIQAHAAGSLKQANIQVKSQYNKFPIEGKITGKPLEKNVPFNAQISWQEVQIPYAKEQDIRLKRGILTASGLVNDIKLDVNTKLTAKDIPEGQYKGLARTDGYRMTIEQLLVELPEGNWLTTGVLDWQERFYMTLNNVSSQFNVRKLLTKDIAPYVPEMFDGSLDVTFKEADAQNPMEVSAILRQNDGETVVAQISQPNGKQQPITIATNWQNVIRKNLPNNIGDVNSPSGNAKIIYQQNNNQKKFNIIADAKIQQLNIAPQGDYQVNLDIQRQGRQIDIHQFNYQGEIGDLTGQGNIQLAHEKSPLKWQINAKTQGLKTQQFDKNIPVNHLVGTVIASGTMQTIRQKQGSRLVRHAVTIQDIDMFAEMAESYQKNVENIKVIGKGSGQFDLQANQLNYMMAKFVGDVTTPNLPSGRFDIDMAGTPKKLNFNRLVHQGDLGEISAKGNVDLTKDIRWQLEADMKNFNAGYFVPEYPNHVTGHIISSGDYQQDKKILNHISAKFKGSLDAENLPSGQYQVDLSGNTKKMDIRQLIHQGDLGEISAKGNVDLTNDIRWQLEADMKNFNAGYFVPEYPTQVTGHIITSGDFQREKKLLKQISAKFNGNIVGKNIPSGKINADIAGNTENVNIHHFSHQGDLGEISAKGKLNLTNGIRWQAEADLKNFNVGYFSPQFANKLTGNIITNGDYQLEKKQLKQISAKFDGNLIAKDLPSGQLQVDLSGNTEKIDIHHFNHQSNVGYIQAKGNIDLTNGINWNAQASMKNFNIGQFVSGLPSRITGEFDSHGYWRNNGQFIQIEKMNLQGQLKNQTLTAKGNLITKLNLPKNLTDIKLLVQEKPEKQIKTIRQIVEKLNVSDLMLAWGKNTVVANGDETKITTKVDISTLNQLIPALKGTIKGDIIVAQEKQTILPSIYFDLVGKKIALPNFAVADSKITGKIVNFANSPSQLKVSATGINISDQPIRAIKLDFDGTQPEHWLNVDIDSEQGQVQASLKGGIDLVKKRWEGVIGNGQIGTAYAKLQQRQPAQILVDWQQPRLQLASHCWQMAGQTGNLCLKENLLISANEGRINTSLQKIDSQIFSVFLPKDIFWQGIIHGNALINWKKNQRPSVNASFYTDNGSLGMSAEQPDEQPVTIDYDRVSIITRSTNDGLKLRADVKTAKGTGNGYLDATINPYKQDKPIQGTVVFQDVNLSVLKPFLPSFERLTGTGLMAGKISGSLLQPKFVGDMEIQDGEVTVTGVPIKLNNINILTHVEGNKASIDGTFNSTGSGKGTMIGTIDWTKELQAKLKIQGNQLQVNQPPLIFAEINPIFDVIVRPQQKFVNIEGVIDMPRAIIRPPEATEDVITKSNDVTVIDRRLMGQIDDVLKVVAPWSINADVGVDLGKEVNFIGFGANLPLAGALNITQRGQGTMKAQGVVQVAKRSKVEIFGQNLNINYSQIRFNGVVANPNLNIETVKDVQGVTVGVRIKGTVEEPNIMVFNNGGLTEQQAMNALILGSLTNTTGEDTSTEAFKSRVNTALAAAGLSFGLKSTHSLTNQIGKAFGLESLTLDASGMGSDAEVNITGYITPDLYIRYGVGVFNTTNTLSMRYQLTRRLYIEAKSALTNSIDLIYNWRF